MKFSKYNNFIKLSDGKWIGFNAFTRHFIVLDEATKLAIDHCLTSSKDVKDTDFDDHTTFDKLVESGFIINDTFDELKVLKSDIRKLDFETPYHEITINPTMDCNFKCWYCYESHQEGSEMNRETVESVKKYLSTYINATDQTFRLSFFGGEPLMKFDAICKPLIEYAASLVEQQKGHLHIGFTSNSYLLTDEICDFLSKFSCSMQITLDGHRAFHNLVRYQEKGKGSYDTILSNITKLTNAGISVILRINYTYGNLKSVKSIIEDVKERGIHNSGKLHVDLQRVWQDKENDKIDEIRCHIIECQQMLHEMGIDAPLAHLNNPRINSCYGDKSNYVCINFNGDVYKCTARKFDPERRAGILNSDGTITWDKQFLQLWEHSKFNSSRCHNCRIAPICLGGCRQRAIESGNNPDICPKGYDDESIDTLILDHFEQQYLT